MTTAEYLATAVTEHHEQSALFEWRDLVLGQYPELAPLHSIPNGGYRPKGTAVKMKKEGTLAGVPDICLPYAEGGYHGLYIEMKRVGGSMADVDPDQAKVIATLRRNGYAVMVCFGFEEARETLINYVEGEPLPSQKDISGVPNRFGRDPDGDRWVDLIRQLREKDEAERKAFYPLTVSNITANENSYSYMLRGSLSCYGNVGKWVSIRPVTDNPDGKTYLGLLLGSFATGVSAQYYKETQELVLSQAHHNPAIFVFELNRVVFGNDSWWAIIKDADQLRQITDQDINSVWYVRALGELGSQATDSAKDLSN